MLNMKTEQEMKLWEKEFGLDLPTEEEMEEMSKYFLGDELYEI